MAWLIIASGSSRLSMFKSKGKERKNGITIEVFNVLIADNLVRDGWYVFSCQINEEKEIQKKYRLFLQRKCRVQILAPS